LATDDVVEREGLGKERNGDVIGDDVALETGLNGFRQIWKCLDNVAVDVWPDSYMGTEFSLCCEQAGGA
jgi:hypothetical protein